MIDKNLNGNNIPPIDIKKINTKIKKFSIIGICLIIVLILISSATYTIARNQYAYVTRFSKAVAVETEPGLAFKVPFIDKVKFIPSYQMLYDIPPSDVITADKQTLVVDNFTIWKIENPQQFMKTIANIQEMESRISASVYNAVKNIIGGLTRAEIINENTDSVSNISKKVTQTVNQNLAEYGISITSVEIKRLDLPEANTEAVYTRMISERNQMADAYLAEGQLQAQKIRNDTDKEVAVILATAEADSERIRGEAESEYMRILSEAYSGTERESFYEFIRTLDALKITMNTDKTRTLILDENSYIIKALLGKDI